MKSVISFAIEIVRVKNLWIAREEARTAGKDLIEKFGAVDGGKLWSVLYATFTEKTFW